MQSDKHPPPGMYPDHPPPYSSGPSHAPSQPYMQPMQPMQPVHTMQPTVVHTTMVPTMVPVVVGQPMGPTSTRITCRSCTANIVTRVESRPSLRTHLFAALLCILGFWPCVCIPYCVDSCNNADHYCPNCNSYIGSYMN